MSDTTKPVFDEAEAQAVLTKLRALRPAKPSVTIASMALAIIDIDLGLPCFE